MNWDYEIAKKALKKLKRVPKNDQRRVFEALEEMKINPFHGDVKPIQGIENLWRRRIGAYRIYFRPLYEQHLLDIPEIERKQSR
jgi:mRNA-degrading endonuclease RelE of RelBE toxin-antitoxin system